MRIHTYVMALLSLLPFTTLRITINFYGLCTSSHHRPINQVVVTSDVKKPFNFDASFTIITSITISIWLGSALMP